MNPFKDKIDGIDAKDARCEQGALDFSERIVEAMQLTPDELDAACRKRIEFNLDGFIITARQQLLQRRWQNVLFVNGWEGSAIIHGWESKGGGNTYASCPTKPEAGQEVIDAIKSRITKG